MNKGSIDDGVVFHAGFPNAAEDGKLGGLSLDALVVRHRASTFFWRLETEVTELSWPKGSIVVVDRALNVSEGKLAVVIVEDTFLLCRFHRSGFQNLGGEPVDGELWGVVTYVIQPVSRAVESGLRG